jgi:hypothetical protein
VMRHVAAVVVAGMVRTVTGRRDSLWPPEPATVRCRRQPYLGRRCQGYIGRQRPLGTTTRGLSRGVRGSTRSFPRRGPAMECARSAPLRAGRLSRLLARIPGERLQAVATASADNRPTAWACPARRCQALALVDSAVALSVGRERRLGARRLRTDGRAAASCSSRSACSQSSTSCPG